jgi:hypothetical protein
VQLIHPEREILAAFIYESATDPLQVPATDGKSLSAVL